MKIAIHHNKGSFSERWITYCEDNNLEYKLVSAFDTDIVNKLKGYDVFMWHHHHADYKESTFAKNILFALEHAGIKVFPDFKTGWHFDNKVAQKYLLEALDVPTVPSYIFYDKEDSVNWAEKASFPKVFKLKGGAGAANVKLVNSKKEAFKLIDKAFGKGFPQFDRVNNLKEKVYHFKRGRGSLLDVSRGVGRLFIGTKFSKQKENEKGYVYFQDFIPNNSYDLRVIVTGNKAIAAKRYVRENDFRASGSGGKSHKREDIDERTVKIAFDINEKLRMQTVSYDFVYDSNGDPLIVEISYGFPILWADDSPGYWDNNLNWHEERVNPAAWILEDIIHNQKV